MRCSLTVFCLTLACALSAHAQAGKIFTPHDRHQRFGSINVTTGAGADIGAFGINEPGYRLASGAFDVNGDYYSIALLPGTVGSQLARIDVTTGAATTIGPRGEVPLLGMEVDDDGVMYAVRLVAPMHGIEGDPILYSVDKTDGSLTAIGDTEVEHVMDLAFDPQGTLWAVGGGQGGGNRLYTIDPTTGASTFVTDLSDASGEIDVAPGGAEIMGIMFDEHGALFGTAFLPGPDPNDYMSPLFSIDSTTGLATVIGQTGFRLPHGGDYLIPEPGTIGMILIGSTLIPFVRRRCSLPTC